MIIPSKKALMKYLKLTKMTRYEEILKTTNEFGYVYEVNYPIIKVIGLPNIKVGELTVTESGIEGVVVSLTEKFVEIAIFENVYVKAEEKVVRTNERICVSVSTNLLGKIIDPLGKDLRENKYLNIDAEKRSIDVFNNKIIDRDFVNRQLITGLSIIDTMVPLGMGQRQLVLGGRKTGKTYSILNIANSQIKRGTVVVYCLIGKQRSEVKKLIDIFAAEKMMDQLVVVATFADESPSKIDLTPYSAMTIAEYFKDLGKDVLLIFDDLTTHAHYYREMSLILGRFPGRDSYPGDIFFKHAKLLERGGCFKSKNEIGQATITCLGIAETNEKQISEYIISNLIGITDGHLLFDEEAFNQGRRPAIDLYLSVTRVGKQTQRPILRSVNNAAYKLMNRYKKSASFKHFGAELSDRAKKMLERGDRLYSFFSQDYKTNVAESVQILFTVLIIGGIMDNVKFEDMDSYKNNFINNFKKPEISSKYEAFLNESKNVPELIEKLKGSLDELLSLCKQ